MSILIRIDNAIDNNVNVVNSDTNNKHTRIILRMVIRMPRMRIMLIMTIILIMITIIMIRMQG